MGKKLGNPSLCFTMTSLQHSTGQHCQPHDLQRLSVGSLAHGTAHLLVVSITKENPPTSNSTYTVYYACLYSMSWLNFIGGLPNTSVPCQNGVIRPVVDTTGNRKVGMGCVNRRVKVTGDASSQSANL